MCISNEHTELMLKTSACYVVQALAASETAYAHAMTVTSSIPLPGECDGDIMKAALNAFSSLPQVTPDPFDDDSLNLRVLPVSAVAMLACCSLCAYACTSNWAASTLILVC